MFRCSHVTPKKYHNLCQKHVCMTACYFGNAIFVIVSRKHAQTDTHRNVNTGQTQYGECLGLYYMPKIPLKMECSLKLSRFGPFLNIAIRGRSLLDVSNLSAVKVSLTSNSTRLVGDAANIHETMLNDKTTNNQSYYTVTSWLGRP